MSVSVSHCHSLFIVYLFSSLLDQVCAYGGCRRRPAYAKGDKCNDSDSDCDNDEKGGAGGENEGLEKEEAAVDLNPNGKENDIEKGKKLEGEKYVLKACSRCKLAYYCGN